MDDAVKKAWGLLVARMDQLTTWVGILVVIGVLLHLGTLLLVLGVALIVFPDTQFSEIFKKWTEGVRNNDPFK